MRAIWSTFVGAALATVIQAAPASAQLMTFVAATGNDANTCLVQANPCKTLQRAINVTAATGEVRILSQLQSNGFVAKSLTIDGGGNTVVGTIAINSAPAIVTLKNLSLNGIGGFATGINIINAAVVHIENCTTERFTDDGINLAANVSTELFISDSISRDNSDHGLQLSGPTTAKVTIDSSRLENNANSGLRLEGGALSVSRSIASGNNFAGLEAVAGTANIVGTTAMANGGPGFVTAFGAAITLESCVSRGNGNQGLSVENISLARISNSVFTNNVVGIQNAGTAFSLGDNVVAGNGTELSGGALTPLGGL